MKWYSGVLTFCSGLLIGFAFYSGMMLERVNWYDEVVGRGFAHMEGDKLVWDK